MEDKLKNQSSENQRKRHLVIVGSSQSGKTSLASQILIATKRINSIELKKIKDEAKELNITDNYLGLILDSYQEEKKKQQTVETSKMELSIDQKPFVMYDCPGSPNAISLVIKSIAISDIVLFVLSYDEDVSDQLRYIDELSFISQAFGVNNRIGVLSKMDLCDWSESIFQKILNSFKESNIDFATAICSIQNQNISKDKEDFPSPSVFGLLNEVSNNFEEEATNVLRIIISDIFQENEQTSIFGKILDGAVSIGDNVLILPQNIERKVIKVLGDLNQELPKGIRGENVWIVFERIEDTSEIQIVSQVEDRALISKEFECELELNSNSASNFISLGETLNIHIHTIVRRAEITSIYVLAASGKKNTLNLLKKDQIANVRLQIDSKICIEKFEKCKEMGSFVLRSEKDTVARGIITKVKVC